jgi:hypothetical protein
VDGPTGPAGAAGAAGAAGPAGAAGHDGTAGTNGAPGTNGTTTGETLYAETLGLGTNFGTVCGTPSGPSITFTAPTAAYVQVMAQADMQRSGSASNAVCLKVDGDPATPIMSSTSLSYETVSPANPIVLPVSAGSHTISLQYTSSGSSSNFKNRRLWVTVFHPTA